MEEGNPRPDDRRLLHVCPGHGLEVAELSPFLGLTEKASPCPRPRPTPRCHSKLPVLRDREREAHRGGGSLRRTATPVWPLPPALLLLLQAAEGTERLLGWVAGVLGSSGEHPKGGNQGF